MILAAPQNYASMPQLKVSGFVEIYDLAVQRNVQPNSRDRNINEVWVCSFVCQQLTDSVLARFHVYAPRFPTHTQRWTRGDYMSNAWLREVINSGGVRQLGDIRRDPPRLTITKLSPARLIAQIFLSDGPCKPVGPFPETPCGSSRSEHRL